MRPSASLARRKAAKAGKSIQCKPYRRDNKYEAFDSIADGRYSGAVLSSATDLGRGSRRGRAGVQRCGEQRQNLSTLGLPRKVCGPRVAQQRVPLRGQAVQERQHAEAAKAVDGPGRRLVYDPVFRSG